MKKSTVIIIWGLIASLLMAAYSYVLYASGASFTNRSLSYLSYVILIICLIMGMLQFRNKVNGGYATFGQQYVVGILIIVIVAIVNTAYFAIFLHMTPEFMDKMMEQAQTDMVNKGLSPEQIAKGMEMAKNFTSTTAVVIFGLLGTVFIGAIVNLITAAITAKAKPFMEEDNIAPQS